MKPSSPHGLNPRGLPIAHGLNRRGRTIAPQRIAMMLPAFALAIAFSAARPVPAQAAEYALTPLPPHSVQFTGLFEEVI